jgi:hypothetical protein
MRGWRQREGLEDAKPVGLKMEEGSQASRNVGVSKSRNQKEVSSEPTEGTHHLDFRALTPRTVR